jgi:hypothetical protein
VHLDELGRPVWDAADMAEVDADPRNRALVDPMDEVKRKRLERETALEPEP